MSYYYHVVPTDDADETSMRLKILVNDILQSKHFYFIITLRFLLEAFSSYLNAGSSKKKDLQIIVPKSEEK